MLLLFAPFAVAGLASLSTANANQIGCCGGELWNGFEPPDPNNAIGFEGDFTGDLTGQIAAQVTTDEITNAFADLQAYNGSPLNPITVTYDLGANLTRVTFSGGALPSVVPATCVPPQTPPGCWPITTFNNNYHFGVDGGYGQPTAPLFGQPTTSTHWIYSEGILQLPGLIAYWDGSFTKKSKVLWAAFFVEDVTGKIGGWQLIPYSSKEKGVVKIALRNRGNAPVTLGSIGYELGLATPRDKDCVKSPSCAANIAALDSLGPEAFPPPGEPGSPFKSVKLPKKPLQPGDVMFIRAR